MSSEDGIIGEAVALSGAIFVVFISLKLAKIISWSWWWVTSPLLFLISVFILALLITFIVYMLCKC